MESDRESCGRKPEPATAPVTRLLRLVLCRMWQRTPVLEHLAEITAIDPAAAGRAADEMLGVALRRFTHSFPEDGAAGNV